MANIRCDNIDKHGKKGHRYKKNGTSCRYAGSGGAALRAMADARTRGEPPTDFVCYLSGSSLPPLKGRSGQRGVHEKRPGTSGPGHLPRHIATHSLLTGDNSYSLASLFTFFDNYGPIYALVFGAYAWMPGEGLPTATPTTLSHRTLTECAESILPIFTNEQYHFFPFHHRPAALIISDISLPPFSFFNDWQFTLSTFGAQQKRH